VWTLEIKSKMVKFGNFGNAVIVITVVPSRPTCIAMWKASMWQHSFILVLNVENISKDQIHIVFICTLLINIRFEINYRMQVYVVFMLPRL